MKIERNNKYNKCKSLGLAVILASGIILSGCNNVEREVVEPTEVVEVTPTPPLTPTVEPTIEPTATPMPELSYEEEIALLGINGSNKIATFGNITVFEYTINGQRKIMFAHVNTYPNENGGHDVYEWFTDTDEVMFTLNYDIYGTKGNLENYDCKDISIVSAALEGSTIERGYFIYYLPEKFEKIGIEVNASQYDNLFHPNVINSETMNAIAYTPMTYQEIADMYLALVPKEYRVTAAELDPANYVVEEDKVLVK